MEPAAKEKGIKYEHNLANKQQNNIQQDSYFYSVKQQNNPVQYQNHTNTKLYQASNHYSIIPTTTTTVTSNSISNNNNNNLLDLSYIPYQSQWNNQLRDSLLQYAHTVYSTMPQNSLLLTILNSIHHVYPTHLPTLLLLACVCYSQKDYDASLRYNQLILKYEPNYVEAMNNIGTTLKVLGKIKEAEDWWYKAVKLRPNYWDAIENLIGNLCSTTSLASITNTQQQSNLLIKRYYDAIELCNYVENYYYKSDLIFSPPKHFPLIQLPRLQNIFYTKGNLKLALGDLDGAQMEYEKALELVFGGSNLLSIIQHMASICGSSIAMEASHSNKSLDSHSLPLILLQPIQAIQILQLMYPHTNGLLPSVTLTNLNYFSISSSSSTSTSTNGSSLILDTITTESILKKLLQSTSSVLLSLAKLLQDKMNSTPTTNHITINSNNNSSNNNNKTYNNNSISKKIKKSIRRISTTPSMSVLLPLYYLSIALNPNPSTINNLGILLTNVTSSTNTIQLNLNGNTTTTTTLDNNYSISGTLLAMQYYMYGLQIDNKHSHLYTNLGSLLKDMGHLNEAVRMYEKAIEINPQFDVALANLGNTLKDMGKIQDSIQWYQRAVQINPDFIDAICGLVNSLMAVCDWRDRGTVYSDDHYHLIIDKNGYYIPKSPSSSPSLSSAITSNHKNEYGIGWMGQIVSIVEKHLNSGVQWGTGILNTSIQDVSLSNHLINIMTTFSSSDYHISTLKNNLYKWTLLKNDKKKKKKNEGGWFIRLIERLIRRMQRYWYLQHYGNVYIINENDQQQQQQSQKLNNVIIVDEQLAKKYKRPCIPKQLATPPIPSVLPFHAFTYPLTARQTRLISHRNALRISHTTLTSSWISPYIYPPPPPPHPRIKVGYVSSDFNNHPLSHLMQSVFGFHNQRLIEVFCYALTPSDQSNYRLKIEKESEHFLNVSQWSNQQIVNQIVKDQIHILVNLNGYTKGGRNEIFAARPCPVQCSFMGFASTLGGGWCDWIIADPIVCPPEMVSCEVWRKRMRQQQQQNDKLKNDNLIINNNNNHNDNIINNNGIISDFDGDLDPEELSNDFVYTEKFIYMPHSYFVNDHKQGFQEIADEEEKEEDDDNNINNNNNNSNNNDSKEEEEDLIWKKEKEKRKKMRKELFPNIPDDTIIFANFNQLYKLEPSTFHLWLRILERVPNSLLWLLKFPAAGEEHLKRTVSKWATSQQQKDNVIHRIVFTDVAPKKTHIQRGRIVDIFLDTPECNAHTTASDILWMGTPFVTYPKYQHKMCSRVGASIAYATGFGDEMVVYSENEYENRAVQWAQSLSDYSDTIINENNTSSSSKNIIQKGYLMDLRKRLFLSRRNNPLFDTKRWTRNLEKGYQEAWRRWVSGEEMEDITFNPTDSTGCIWVHDSDP
ncbi:unnamed protein product [Cunninghamella blakesleeana]